LIREGQKVVDLGASPGGWLQVAREIVGPEGLVIGVDIKPISPIPFPNVHLLEGDIYDLEIEKRILNELGGSADVLLSDLSPQIIGAWDVDHARQIDLARRAIAIAKSVLRPKGNALIKMFHGPELKGLQEEAGKMFYQSRLYKPQASRPESSEIYFLGLGLKKWVTREREKAEGQERDQDRLTSKITIERSSS
jgi:23S rRNA (uridine2552-2'-O)-methyltransferase